MNSTCEIHGVKLICPACLGSKGGKRKSIRKAEAVRANGKLGGRPRQRVALKEGK